jgi:hypothetical protein
MKQKRGMKILCINLSPNLMEIQIQIWIHPRIKTFYITNPTVGIIKISHLRNKIVKTASV